MIVKIPHFPVWGDASNVELVYTVGPLNKAQCTKLNLSEEQVGNYVVRLLLYIETGPDQWFRTIFKDEESANAACAEIAAFVNKSAIDANQPDRMEGDEWKDGKSPVDAIYEDEEDAHDEGATA